MKNKYHCKTAIAINCCVNSAQKACCSGRTSPTRDFGLYRSMHKADFDRKSFTLTQNNGLMKSKRCRWYLRHGPCQERGGSLIRVRPQDHSLQGMTDQLKAHAIFYRYYGKGIGRVEAPRTISISISMGLFGTLHRDPREEYLGRIRLLRYDGRLSAEQHLTRCNLATLLSDTEAMIMTSSVCIA